MIEKISQFPLPDVPETYNELKRAIDEQKRIIVIEDQKRANIVLKLKSIRDNTNPVDDPLASSGRYECHSQRSQCLKRIEQAKQCREYLKIHLPPTITYYDDANDRRVFYCNLCETRCVLKNQWWKHLDTDKHKDKVNVCEFRRVRYGEDFKGERKCPPL